MKHFLKSSWEEGEWEEIHWFHGHRITSASVESTI
jgi:hypothetical protein